MNMRKRIADLPLPVHMAIRLRRFSERIIRNHMQFYFDDATRNGEYWILSKLAPSCRSFVDVGANRGEFSATFLSRCPAAHGLIFDPGQSAYNKLIARFADEHSVRVARKAVSDFCGRAPFFEEPDTGLSSSLAQTWACPEAQRIEIEVTTLDAALADWGGADYVKIDAEGHDLAVIRGASTLLAGRSIRFLQFEYHTAWLYSGATLRAAIDFLSSFGYHTYLLKGEGLYEPNCDAYGEYFWYSNYFAVCPDEASQVSNFVRGKI
jgi:FkbM family methyltransferase